MTNLILCGFKSCGKTTLGKKLAQEIGAPFIDTDHLLESLYEQEEGEPLACSEIYKKLGEMPFRQLEYRAVASLEGVSDSIIALGGGAVLFSENQIILQKIGLLVYLEMDQEVLKKRLFSGPLPALFEDQSFEKLYQERRPLYEAISSHKILLDGKTDEQILNQLKKVMYGK